jgi:hypothetical protein
MQQGKSYRINQKPGFSTKSTKYLGSWSLPETWLLSLVQEMS